MAADMQLTPEHYLRRYLRRAPAALALWRSIEARHFGSAPLTRPLLDVGCGFGEFGAAFFDEPANVGVDINPADLALARKTGAYRRLVHGDARALPFTDGSFESVMSVSVLEHIPDVQHFFPEAFRVLRPGSHLVFSVPLQDMDAYMLVPPLARSIGLQSIAANYARRVHRAFKHVNLHEEPWWLEHAAAAGFQVKSSRRIISRAATRAFDAGLPSALLSQIGRLRGGERLVWHPTPIVNLWTRILLPIVTREEEPGDGSNLFVVARKPLV